jgi:hypothetical protein
MHIATNLLGTDLLHKDLWSVQIISVFCFNDNFGINKTTL